MTINFVCRGNAFRSRLAEAYFNSLQLKDVTAISSGTVAELHSKANANNFKTTAAVLQQHGLEKYSKEHWTQLSPGLLNEDNFVIFLSQSVEQECQQLFGLPEHFITWAIPDYDEISPIPGTEDQIYEYVEMTFQKIVKNITDYIKNVQEDA